MQSREVENDLSNDSYEENIKTDRLIVMDHVSGLAGKSNKFLSFLTVARKLGYRCVYIIDIIHPETSISKLILLQTFLIFFLVRYSS